MILKRTTSIAGTALLAGAGLIATVAPASAATTNTTGQAAGPCGVYLGSVKATGAVSGATVTASTPPTASGGGQGLSGVFSAGEARLGGTWYAAPNPEATTNWYGFMVLGSAMYYTGYLVDSGGKVDPDSVTKVRIGGGWDKVTAFQVSDYVEQSGSFARSHAYALRSDGTLTRWTLKNGWTNAQSYPGFSAVKSMTLISQTRTYDTLLANTTTGSLITIHIPTTSPLQPVVKRVRDRSWQGLDYLAAERCGSSGTVLAGLDRDTNSVYVYTFGKAIGSATVIKSYGKATGTLTDPVYHRVFGEPGVDPPLNGE
jgi:hypothetical protein